MSKPYRLRQTTPDQIMTHWDTCYTEHSACMERKVETMTQHLNVAVTALRHLAATASPERAEIAKSALLVLGVDL